MGQITVVGEDGTPKSSEPKEQISENRVSSPVVQEIQAAAIAEAMGLDKMERGRYSDDIETLLTYARANTKDHSIEGLKWAIRNLEVKLGSPPLSEKRISYVSRFAYLMSQKARTDNELKQFKWGGKR